MKNRSKSLSLASKGIRYKLIVVFSLMALIPMFVFGYLIYYYIFPNTQNFWEVFLIFLITVFLMLIGFYLAKKIVHPIAQIAMQAKDIAAGKTGTAPETCKDDEVGQLSYTLTRLSDKLKENMGQLHLYGEKIKEINMDINRKMFALSSLLQIGNLITENASLGRIFNLIVEKLAQLQMQGLAFLMLLEEDSRELVIRAQVDLTGSGAGLAKISAGSPAINKILNQSVFLIRDAQRSFDSDEQLNKVLFAKNIAVFPIIRFGKAIGILITGNNEENFIFSKDEVELIEIFAKQLTLATENEALARRTEELTVTDELTGLYNEGYIREHLDEEIKRAVIYQRPCSFLIFELVSYKAYYDALGRDRAEEALKRASQIFMKNTSGLDKVARFGECQFAILLPEKNKQQSLGVAGPIQKETAEFNLQKNMFTEVAPFRLIGGISAAPIDGRNANELINKALAYVEKAKKENKIIIS